jgi:cytochrome c-type biogenesis protein CcmH/NrfG
MNEQQITYRIKQLLNRGLDLDAGKLARLNAAREAALARQRIESRVPVLAWADNLIGKSGGPSALIPRVLLPMAVLILGLIAVNQWRDSQLAAEIEEIDTAVLTSDLPIDAYLDKGFDAWLKRSSH